MWHCFGCRTQQIQPLKKQNQILAEVEVRTTTIDHLYVVHPGQHTFPLTVKITASTLPDTLLKLGG